MTAETIENVVQNLINDLKKSQWQVGAWSWVLLLLIDRDRFDLISSTILYSCDLISYQYTTRLSLFTFNVSSKLAPCQ